MRLAATQLMRNRRWRAIGIVVLAAIAMGGGGWLAIDRIPRRPPSVFDAPVDGVLSFLAEEDFNRLPVEQRMAFLQDVMKRFGQMDQSDSLVASSFLAGLTGPANEKLIGNARILGKDILVQGAADFLALKSEQERARFLDGWITRWFRVGDSMRGDGAAGLSDEQILDRIAREGRRDLERGIEIDARVAQQIASFWDRDVASVASPREQAQIYQFLPAVRSHLLRRGE